MSELTLCVGATGAQGGSVARALLRRGRAVRALTRHPSSPAAQALSALGASLFEGDLGDLAQLHRAMEGCTSVFGVTNYWEHFGSEIAQGKNLVDAAVSRKIRHLVLSTLPSPEALSHGQLAVPHMESKASIEAYARRFGGLTTTALHVAFYYENFLSWFVPRPSADGTLAFGFPQGQTPLAAVSVEDVGDVVAAVLDQPALRHVDVVGDEQPCDAYAASMSEVLGKPVRYQPIEAADYARLPFPGAADLAAMFDLNRRFIPTRAVDLASTRALSPSVSTFRDWAHAHAAELRAACGA
jgi:uncharacterized protein YbjT (DUF2867 family)